MASPMLSMFANLQWRVPRHAVTLTTSSLSAPRGVPFFPEVSEEAVEPRGVDVGQLDCLPAW